MTFDTSSGPSGGPLSTGPGAPRLNRWARESDPALRSRTGAQPHLQSLAQEYAAKLRQAGYSVAQGVAALQQSGKSVVARPAAAAGVAAEIRELEAMARTVFGADVDRWLQQPNHLLGGHTPASMMFAPTGRSKVRQLLKAYALAA